MKKLQNNFTTPEQSKLLLELGVPAWTADCYYTESDKIKIKDTALDILYTPCWSVGRLIEICCISMGMSGYPHTFENQVANLILMLSQAKKHMGVNFSKLEE